MKLDTEVEISKRNILKRKQPKEHKKEEIIDETTEFSLNDEEAVELYESLLHVFSSRDHLIVGRNEEEQAIKTFIENNIKQDITGLLYICGHPG